MALLAAVAGLTAVLAAGGLLGFDLAVRDWCLDHRWEPLRLLARGLNQLGSANLMAAVCAAVAVPLVARARSAAPLLPIVAAYALSHLAIGPVKLLTDRAAPLTPAADAVELFAAPGGMSFPSGHVVNTFVCFQALVLLLHAWRPAGLTGRIRLALRLLPPVVVSMTVTYLAFHWFTDVLAALLLGLFLDRSMRRFRWHLGRQLPAEMDTCRSGG